MVKYYEILKDMPHHVKGDLLTWTGQNSNVYIWEFGEQYSLPAEIVETTEDWFKEAFPEWIQNEPCYYITLNGIVAKDYFRREDHSTLHRFGNMFKSEQDANLALSQISQILLPSRASL
jgi:hypothetical protein